MNLGHRLALARVAELERENERLRARLACFGVVDVRPKTQNAPPPP